MKATISLINGDGIGVDVSVAAIFLVKKAMSKAGGPVPTIVEIASGASYFDETGKDIQPNGEAAAGAADAIFLGAIGLPEIRHGDGNEISPHVRLRDRYQLYAGVRLVRAYPHAPMHPADTRGGKLVLVITRESTEGLFYSVAVHGRSKIIHNAV